MADDDLARPLRGGREYKRLDVDLEQLHSLYVDQGMMRHECATLLGVAPITISKRLREMGVSSKDQNPEGGAARAFALLR